MIITKVGGKSDISFFMKMCYLWSTLHSNFQNHLGHLVIFKQNISLEINPKPNHESQCAYSYNYPLSCNFSMRTCVKFKFANKIEATYERLHVNVKVESRSTSRLISTIYILPT